MKPVLSSSLEAKYRTVLDTCMRSPAYYRYKFCGTRNKKLYLKVVTRRGMYFSDDELRYIEDLVTRLAPKKYILNTNRLTGSLTVTFYE